MPILAGSAVAGRFWRLDAGGWREARNGESLEKIGVAG
jgi:hypothetical protein